MPDLTIVLMVNPEQGIERIKANSLRDFNRLDQEKLSLHKKVYEGYRKILDDKNEFNIKEIDASKEINVVFGNVLQIVKKFIKEHYNA
jgi:dTMP kinase